MPIDGYKIHSISIYLKIKGYDEVQKVGNLKIFEDLELQMGT